MMEIILSIFLLIVIVSTTVSIGYLARMATKPNVVVYANKLDLLKNPVR